MDRRNLLHGGLCLCLPKMQAQSDGSSERDFAAEIEHVLDLVRHIRPGDLRKSLEHDWKQDGGMQMPSPTRYLLRTCNSIKIDVECRQVDVTRLFGNPDDIITQVSKPYLDLPHYD